MSCFDFIAISEENSVLANSGSPIFGCPGGLIDRRERGREEKIVSHRARRERREERTNLQRQKAEMFFSVTPVGSSEAGVSKELCGENLIWDRYDPGPPSARTRGLGRRCRTGDAGAVYLPNACGVARMVIGLETTVHLISLRSSLIS